MTSLFYGLFGSRKAAERAIEALSHETGGEGINAVLHEGHLDGENLQMGGTDVRRSAALGAVVVGCLAAGIGVLLLTPRIGLGLGWFEFMLIAIAGTIMGVTAGALAGSSEPGPELRPLVEKLGPTDVLVTIETGAASEEAVCDLLRANGASDLAVARY